MFSKIVKFFAKEEERSDFAEFFSKPIDEQKKVIKAVVKEANDEQKELYEKYNSTLVKTS
jgi:hypothetical protein